MNSTRSSSVPPSHLRSRGAAPPRRSRIVGTALAGMLTLLAGLLGAVATAPGAIAAPTGNVVVDPAWQPTGVTGGGVESSVVKPDGTILIGGSFTTVSGRERRGLALLRPDGTLDPRIISQVTGSVAHIVLQADGRIVIAGRFDAVDGIPRPGIARLNADGTLDPTFTPGVTYVGNVKEISAVAVQPDGRIVLAGLFTYVSGGARNGIARVNSNGTLDGSFNPGSGLVGSGTSGGIQSIVVLPTGAVLIGGSFGSFDGVGRNGIARLSAGGSVDGTFNPGAGFLGPFGLSGPVQALAVQPDGKVLATGGFITFNGTARAGIARLNTNGSLDSSFAPGTGFTLVNTPPMQPVNASALALRPDGKVVVGGDFEQYNGTPRSGIVRLAGNGSLDATFDPGAGFAGSGQCPGVRSVAVQPDGNMIVGGGFNSYAGGQQGALVRIAPTGAADTSFVPAVGSGTGFNGAVTSLALQPDGKVVAGGWFGSYNRSRAVGVARLLPDGSLDPGFATGNGVGGGVAGVNAVAIQPDGKVIIGGGFTTYAGVSRHQIARLNADGTLDMGFNPGTGFNGPLRGVQSIAVQPDGKIVVGGDFTSYNGTPRGRIARLNPDGTLDSAFAVGGAFTGEDVQVMSLALQPDGKVLASGKFGYWNNEGWLAIDVVRLTADGSLDMSFIGPWANSSPIFAVSLTSEGRVLIAGSTVRRLLSNGSVDASFTAPTFGSVQAYESVYLRSLAVAPDGSVLVGGYFSSVAGSPRSGIARLLPTGRLDATFNPGAGFNFSVMSAVSGVAALATVPDGRIVVGGGFSGFDGTVPSALNITRLLPVVEAPSAPLNVAVANGDSSALVTFSPPADQGGALVTNYEYSVDGGAWVARVPVSAVPVVTVPGLVNGVAVQVRVRAVNAAGPGVASAAVTVVPVAAVGSVFVPVSPVRVVDSRVAFGGAGPIVGGSSRVVSVASSQSGGVPVVPSGAVAVAYNLTVPSPVAAGHVRVMPGDAVGLTSASAVNFRAGESIANAATVKVSAARTVKVYAGSTADVVIDVVGYFVPAGGGSGAVTSAGAPVGLFTSVVPIRVYDAAVDPAGLLAGGGSRLVSTAVTQSGGVSVVPAGASAVAYNVTVVGPSGPGHLRVAPGDVAGLTPTSAVNWSVAGERIANGSVVGVDVQRRITVFNGGGAPVRFLIDVVGYYSGSGQQFYAVDPVRTTDTRYAFGGAGPIGSGPAQARVLSTATTQAGGFAVVPDGASAVAYNATVAATGSVGHLRVYPAGQEPPTASALNWPGPGYTRANASVVGVSGDRTITVYNGATTPTDTIIDVTGYYR